MKRFPSRLLSRKSIPGALRRFLVTLMLVGAVTNVSHTGENPSRTDDIDLQAVLASLESRSLEEIWNEIQRLRKERRVVSILLPGGPTSSSAGSSPTFSLAGKLHSMPERSRFAASTLILLALPRNAKYRCFGSLADER